MTNLKYTSEEPVSAIATALVPSAIGIVRCSGKGAVELFSKMFSRPKKLMEAEGNTLVYGWIVDGEKKIDEVMVAVYRSPRSFTGEDMVEVFCHGGVSVVTSVFALTLRNGFRQAEGGEFTFRSFINGKTDLTKAEAVKEIIDSKTDSARGRAASRLAGNLFEEIASIKQLVIDSIGDIEVEIEYPEDEENISDAFDTSKLEAASAKLKELADSWKSEKVFQDGAKIVLCGKTNAGKSSLFNTLLKEERAIVSDIEGTTRDWLECWADFGGLPVRLFDTAGLRETDDVIEERGVELAKDLSSEADVVLYLIDSSAGVSDDDIAFLESQKDSGPLIVVLNKADKAKMQDFPELASFCCVKISAKQGSGIDTLVDEVKAKILSADSTEQVTGLGSERQKKSVEEALDRVDHALGIAADGSYGLDAVVQDLEDALDSLGEVTGEVTPEDILGNIFSRFCVGK